MTASRVTILPLTGFTASAMARRGAGKQQPVAMVSRGRARIVALAGATGRRDAG
ncbi:hypothetical protein [Metallibacterium sp.]